MPVKPHHIKDTEHFHRSQKITGTVSQFHPDFIPGHCQILNYFFYHNRLVCILYEWNPTVYILFFLAAFAQDNVFVFIYAVAYISSLFLLLLSTIQLYGSATYCLSTHLLMDIQIVYRYWLLWTKLLWTCRYSLSLRKYLRVEWLDHFGRWKLAKKFFIVIAPIHIPTSSVWEFWLLCFLINTWYSLFFFFILFMAVLGLRFCARAFSSCGKRGPLFIAVRGPLTLAASLVAEHRLQTRRLSSCGSWA